MASRKREQSVVRTSLSLARPASAAAVLRPGRPAAGRIQPCKRTCGFIVPGDEVAETESAKVTDHAVL